MTISILINSVDKTNDIIVDSIKKEDVINDEKDSLRFTVLKYADKGFIPEINDEVVLNIDAVKEFAGVIVEVDKSIQSGQIVVYKVFCLDYSQHLDRQLVLKRYDNSSANEIVDDIVAEYASDFTTTNVDADIKIKTVVFNRITISAGLEKLARLLNYSWYVDYDKDIHFFERNENPAPFEITDTNGNYLQNTLTISNDLSQIRNKVVIRGDKERGNERTETYVGQAGQITIPLANKFAEMPVVNVDSTTKIVGVDFLTEEDSADCFWSFGEKYIRFKEDMDGKEITITGIPLFPVIVSTQDPDSIHKYGVYEFFKEEKGVKSRQEGLIYAQAQLESYANGVVEGKFETDKSGLRSGQIIRIQSDLMDVDEEFLIQKVNCYIESKTRATWSVQLATMRTIGIIQVLQDLIRFREIREFDPDNLLQLLQLQDSCGGTDKINAPIVTSRPYYWQDSSGIDYHDPILWGYWTWEDDE